LLLLLLLLLLLTLADDGAAPVQREGKVGRALTLVETREKKVRARHNLDTEALAGLCVEGGGEGALVEE